MMNDSVNPNHVGNDSAPKTAQRTSLGRRLQRALTGGPNRRFPGLHSPLGGTASPSLLVARPPLPSSLSRRLAFPILALLAAVTVSLLFLLPGGPLHAQDSSTIKYPENGTAAVATYTAVDPEGADITSWTLAGDDADDFMIDGGVLTFMKSPDYEMATDGDRNNDGDFMGTDEEPSDNTYEVTVRATDESNKVGMHEVMVEVTNVDEPGTVTLSALQPQAGTPLTATDSDPDDTVSDLKWQWAKSMTMDGTYEDIDKATLSAYTPKDADIDYYLRVMASYTDAEGEGKTAMATSAYAVQGLRSDNKPPKFADDQDPVQVDGQVNAAREIAENTPAGSAIGDPVVAEDEDGDILTYTLEGNDAGSFDIDRATGQIMTKAALDHEKDGGERTVTVRATDPAGDPQAGSAEADNSDTVMVDITITDVNEPPSITGAAAVTFEEVAGDIATALGVYTEDNPEDDTASTWSVAGADGSKFNIGNETGGMPGELKFKVKPDYEAPTDTNMDNVYEVTVRAADADGNIGTMDVKVSVTNEDEGGVVTLSKIQPRVGVVVTASVTDPDGSVSGLTWQWYDGMISDGSLEMNAIKGANSDTYTPKATDADPNADGNDDDDGITLRAMASYTDGHGADKSASGAADKKVAFDTRNKAPVFADQDTETDGVQNTETTRKVEENTGALATDDATADADDATDNVGRSVTAEDPDPNVDPLTYTLEGTDASKFRVRGNGQIEVGAGTELDYETKTTYMVTVMAEDSFGDSASIMVTITVTDVNEGPDITGEDTIEYPENRTSSVEAYRASDPERAGTITWSLDGTDAADFDISSNGVLTFKKKPNYEMAAGDDTNNMYEVTVEATDADRRMGTKPVTVEVTNVDEPGVVTLSARQPMAGVLLTATLTDPDGTTTNVEWQWQKDSSNISGANMETYTPLDSDRGSYLRATATYKDPESRKDTKTANIRSDYAVLRAASDNNAPKFADDQDPVQVDDQVNAAREIAENTEAGENIGAPVAATDADSDQKLTYTLEGVEAELFDIDRATGQIMTKAALDNSGESAGGVPQTVTVRATDPAGDSDTVMVDITVTDVNEPPSIIGAAAVNFGENSGDITTPLGTYMATDPESEALGPDLWSVAGADGSKFDISEGGVLTFKVKPDYEMPTDTNTDSVYEVTVRAADAEGNIGTMDVKVSVTNEEEGGVVTLSKTRPRVGIAVIVSVTDPDGSISGLIWQWSISDDAATTAPGDIPGATSDTYTPKMGDVGGTLTATARYFDGQNDPDAGATGKKTAGFTAVNMVAVDTRNRAPVFDDQDSSTDGVQNESTTREVAEGREPVAADDALENASEDVADNVGSVITATDPDPNAEALIYTLGGANADKFRVRSNGQIEVGAGTELDYETRTTYEVTVIAEDSFGESASIMVTIMVTDVDEAPVISVGGLVVTGRSSIDYAENGTGMVATYSAAGPDAARATWSLEGDDAGDFRISTAGVLTFRTLLNYEAPADSNTDNVYQVTVKAADGTNTATKAVTVTVTDVDDNQPPSFPAETDTRSVVEGAAAGADIGAPVTAEDPDVGDALTYTLGGTDAASFNVVRTTGQLQTKGALDYSTKTSYVVTVTATDAAGLSDAIAVTINVTAEDENLPPEFPSAATTREVAENTVAGEDIGAPVAASGADDAVLTYALSGADAASFDIVSATGQLQTKADLDYETKASYAVTVTATDDDDASDSIDVAITVTDVDEASTGDPLVDSYDANDNGMIDRAEVGQAVREFIGRQIEHDDVLQIIAQYFKDLRSGN